MPLNVVKNRSLINTQKIVEITKSVNPMPMLVSGCANHLAIFSATNICPEYSAGIAVANTKTNTSSTTLFNSKFTIQCTSTTSTRIFALPPVGMARILLHMSHLTIVDALLNIICPLPQEEHLTSKNLLAILPSLIA